MSCGFLPGAARATYRRCVRTTRLLRRYPEAVQFVGKNSDEVADDDSAARKGEIGITLFGSALLFHSKKQNVLLFIEAAAVQTKDNPNEKKPAANLSSRSFNSYATVLLDKSEVAHKNDFRASESTFEKLLSAQMPRTKTPTLAVKVIFFSTMSLFSHDPSDR